MIKREGQVELTGEMHTKFLSEHRKRKYLIWYLKRRWEDNIKKDITELGCEGAD
jgi:hypothetical protein